MFIHDQNITDFTRTVYLNMMKTDMPNISVITRYQSSQGKNESGILDAMPVNWS